MSARHRIGQGFDLHRLVPGIPLRIGGVTIDSPVGSQGHSDGDVVLHALIDALLGAAGLGDIGEHFPPSDERYRGINSLELLARILPLLKRHRFSIVNVDSTVFLELPKLSPYKSTIRETIAQVLKLPVGQVSVKAKTMEGLGPIGHQEAIAASVIVLLELESEQNSE